MYTSFSFTTSALDGDEWSASRPSHALPPGKGTPVNIVQEAGWTPEPVWTQRLEEKSSCFCQGSNPGYLVIQSVDRHYTDWATLAWLTLATLMSVKHYNIKVDIVHLLVTSFSITLGFGDTTETLLQNLWQFIHITKIIKHVLQVWCVTFTCVPRLTGTVIVVDQINASSSMLALPHTIIDVMVTVFPSPALLALASIVSNQILAWVCIDTWSSLTFVCIWKY
jgi:hypothetical protein